MVYFLFLLKMLALQFVLANHVTRLFAFQISIESQYLSYRFKCSYSTYLEYLHRVYRLFLKITFEYLVGVW